MYKKYIYLGLSVVLLVTTLLWINYQRNKTKLYYESYENNKDKASVDSSKDTVYVDKIIVDSIQLDKLRDSIQILNNMIKNNIQKPITKSNEKVNYISKSSSKQFNDFLADRYKNR